MRYDYEELPNGIEISPNNRAKCRKCFKKVIKGTPRLILSSEYKISFKGGRHSFYGRAYICYECIDNVLNELKDKIRMLKKESKKLNNRLSVKKTKILLELNKEKETNKLEDLKE